MFGKGKETVGPDFEKISQRFARLVSRFETETERVVELASQRVAVSLSASPVVNPKPLLIAEVSPFVCFRTDVFVAMAVNDSLRVRKSLNCLFGNQTALALDRQTSDSQFIDFFNGRILTYTPWAKAFYPQAKSADDLLLFARLYMKTAGFFHRAMYVHHQLSDLLEDSGAFQHEAVAVSGAIANVMEKTVFPPWFNTVRQLVKELRSERE